METNGIIRRIDDLGRIVIPREFRRLHGIDLGDPMEISATPNGEIIVKKADTSEELGKIAKKVAGAAIAELAGTLLVCDFGAWIAGFGEKKNEFVGKPLSPGLSKLLRGRENYSTADGEEEFGNSDGKAHAIVLPAAADGDCFGGVGYLSDGAITKEESAIVRIVAKVIGELMRKF